MKEKENITQFELKGMMDRINIIMGYLKQIDPNSFKNQTTSSEKLGVNRSNFSALVNGDSRYLKPDSKIIKNIFNQYPELNKEWYEKGTGNMLNSQRQIQPNQEVDTVDDLEIPDLEDDDLETVYNSFRNKFVKLPNGEYLMYMPLFEWNVAASLLDNEGDTRHPDYDEVEQYATIVKKPLHGKYSAFRMKGSSMEGTDPRKFIPDGSIVWGRELQMVHWRSHLNLKKFQLWIVGSTEFGRPTLKEIVSHDVETATIVVDSWNPSVEYAHNVPISLNTVKMLYYVMKIETPIADDFY